MPLTTKNGICKTCGSDRGARRVALKTIRCPDCLSYRPAKTEGAPETAKHLEQACDALDFATAELQRIRTERDELLAAAPPEITCSEWMDALAKRWQWNLDKMQAEYDAGYRTPQKMGSMARQKLCLDQFNEARKSASIVDGPPKGRAKKKRKIIKHVCAACHAEFKTKGECWWHMDNDCPARRRPITRTEPPFPAPER